MVFAELDVPGPLGTLTATPLLYPQKRIILSGNFSQTPRNLLFGMQDNHEKSRANEGKIRESNGVFGTLQDIQRIFIEGRVLYII